MKCFSVESVTMAMNKCFAIDLLLSFDKSIKSTVSDAVTIISRESIDWTSVIQGVSKVRALF